MHNVILLCVTGSGKGNITLSKFDNEAMTELSELYLNAGRLDLLFDLYERTGSEDVENYLKEYISKIKDKSVIDKIREEIKKISREKEEKYKKEDKYDKLGKIKRLEAVTSKLILIIGLDEVDAIDYLFENENTLKVGFDLKNTIKFLAETGIDVIDMKISEIEDKTPKFGRRTPELYSGYDFALSRGQNIGNLEGIQPDQTITYSLPNNFNKDVIYLDGTWKANNDNLEAMGDSLIILSFTASSANIVADSLGDIEMEVLIGDSYISKEQAGSDIEFKDGRSFVKITEPRLYNLFDGEYGDYKLTLKVKEGFSFNAFTFG